ncbi:MAG: LEPR-XLL domain-containing protein [Planctomycetaceae bacterium]|nr:LEPR-XLL domain-containing protein [Planctomycetales bacterium]MCB9921256.1 LEPR-XLL domain-containing protein [Planctomycetaceae bacterium]
MKKSPRRKRKHLSTRVTSLAVETLEPRVVLSASGLAVDQIQDRFELRADRSEFEMYRPARSNDDIESFDKQRPARLGQRLQPPLGFDFNLRMSGHDESEIRDRRDSFFKTNHDDRRTSSDRPTPPVDRSGQPEGESSLSTFAYAPVGTSTQSGYELASTTYAEPTSASLSVVLVVVPLVRSSFAGSGNQLSGVDSATLPIASTSTSVSRMPTTGLVDSSEIPRFDVTPPNRESISARTVDVSAAEAATNSTTFVSISNNDLAEWHIDGDLRFSNSVAFGQAQEQNWQATSAKRSGDSAFKSVTERINELTEEALSTRTSEGGFIELSRNEESDSEQGLEIEDINERIAGAKDASNDTARDTFWFDFRDTRIDLLLDLAEFQELAESQIADPGTSGGEEAWLAEEGGMIVLTNAQFIEDAVEVTDPSGSNLAAYVNATSTEIDIPMDARIGMFQAVDVATTLSEQPGTEPVGGGEGEPTAQADDSAPPTEQAAHAETTPPISSQAASMPLLAAIATFFAGRRKSREKNANCRCEV